MSNRRKWESLLPVIQAYADGKDIEYRLGPAKGVKWEKINGAIDFIAPADCYRVKPEPVYRPFADAAEFAPHRDRWVMHIKAQIHICRRVSQYSDVAVLVDGQRLEYSELLEQFVFDDGSPCGIAVDNS